MSKIKFAKNPSEKHIKKITYIKDPVFNSKLFLDMNFNFESLNNSSSISSEDSDEIEDINSYSFLSKELIEEINSFDFGNCPKDDQYINDIKSYNYLINSSNALPKNNINNSGYLQNDYIPSNFNNWDNFYDDYYQINYYKKRYKMIKDKRKDWVCQICFNLNYGFRIECNRCKMPKERCIF